MANTNPIAGQKAAQKASQNRQREQVISVAEYIAENGPQSAAQLVEGLALTTRGGKPNHVLVVKLFKAGFLKVAGKVETGQRGRPAHVYDVTKKAKDRLRRSVKDQVSTQTVPAPEVPSVPAEAFAAASGAI